MASHTVASDRFGIYVDDSDRRRRWSLDYDAQAEVMRQPPETREAHAVKLCLEQPHRGGWRPWPRHRVSLTDSVMTWPRYRVRAPDVGDTIEVNGQQRTVVDVQGEPGNWRVTHRAIEGASR